MAPLESLPSVLIEAICQFVLNHDNFDHHKTIVHFARASPSLYAPALRVLMNYPAEPLTLTDQGDQYIIEGHAVPCDRSAPNGFFGPVFTIANSYSFPWLDQSDRHLGRVGVVNQQSWYLLVGHISCNQAPASGQVGATAWTQFDLIPVEPSVIKRVLLISEWLACLPPKLCHLQIGANTLTRPNKAYEKWILHLPSTLHTLIVNVSMSTQLFVKYMPPRLVSLTILCYGYDWDHLAPMLPVTLRQLTLKGYRFARALPKIVPHISASLRDLCIDARIGACKVFTPDDANAVVEAFKHLQAQLTRISVALHFNKNEWPESSFWTMPAMMQIAQNLPPKLTDLTFDFGCVYLPVIQELARVKPEHLQRLELRAQGGNGNVHVADKAGSTRLAAKYPGAPIFQSMCVSKADRFVIDILAGAVCDTCQLVLPSQRNTKMSMAVSQSFDWRPNPSVMFARNWTWNC
ncbi:hypothetical protein AMAG_19481 [Allomyces macrogynus ATCC 38327]|uniref:F-box domain-containing protein n=1 Tax=Allomyces macrogynus (strain ATCC 38327) TaxID=578462 RepID=A0A0L0SSJ2_ALLM3|nr:hypothetical protein AMAG_19481 [Allomyces macrogynus ATCC 38327]|eukprot:KNE65523.1 hypothetical protein AMAG_19481 [Allomyces macrogynus ATCC 38327]